MDKIETLADVTERIIKLFRDDFDLSLLVGAQDIEFAWANWEERYESDRERRNYRSVEADDPLSVVEHALRRGRNIELTVRVQLGSVDQYPQDVAAVRKAQEMAEAEAAIRAEYEAKMQAAIADKMKELSGE